MTSGSSFSGVLSPAPHGAQGGAEAFVSSVEPQKPIKRRRLTVLSHNKDATSGVLVGQTAASAGKPAKPALVDAQAKAMQPPAPKSLYTGVHWNKSKRKWRVRLKTHGRDTHIGYYALEKDAALSYDRAVRENIPNYTQDTSVRLNFPSDAEAAMMVKGKHGRGSGGRAGNSLVKMEQRDFKEMDPHKSKYNARGTVFEEINKHSDEPVMSGAARCSDYSSSRLSPLIHSSGSSEPSSSELPSPGTRCSSCSTPSMPFGPSMTQMNYVKSEVVHSKGLHAAGAGGIESLQRVVKHIEFQDSREASPASSVSSTCDAAPMELDAVSALLTLSDSPAKSEASSRDSQEDSIKKKKRAAKRKLHQEQASRSGADMLKFQRGSLPMSQLYHEMSTPAPFSHHASSTPSGPSDAERHDASSRASDKEAEPAHNRPAGTPSSLDGGSPSAPNPFPFSRRSQSFRGVTWDKMKKMWRVRVCLAGGGREHVGYFIDEAEGARAYQIALEKLRSRQELKQAAEQQSSEAGLGLSAPPPEAGLGLSAPPSAPSASSPAPIPQPHAAEA